MVKYLVLGLIFSSTAVAMDCNSGKFSASNDVIRKVASAHIPTKTNSSAADTNIERSGCCSHHGGVCGCSSGRAVCCDGQFSPTCGC